MNFLQLKQLVTYWCDDLNMTYFTPTQVGVFLNNAQREVQKLLLGAGQDYYVICKKTTLVVNQREYVLPDDFYKVNLLEVIVSGTSPNESIVSLANIAPSQKEMLPTGNGTPKCYFFKRNRLVLYPAPSSALELKMNYSYKVADMVLDTDVPDVPEPYNEMIAVLAAMDCLYKDTRDSSALKEKRDMYMDMLKKDAAQRNIDQSRQIISTGAYEEYSEFNW